jgi:hypothetical protein
VTADIVTLVPFIGAMRRWDFGGFTVANGNRDSGGR